MEAAHIAIKPLENRANRGIFPTRGTYLLDAETKHVWLELCAEAAICEDPTRLEQLAGQIADILGKEQQRIGARMFPGSPAVKKNVRDQGAA